MLHYVLIHLILIRIFTPVALIALANAKPPGVVVARSAYPFLLLVNILFVQSRPQFIKIYYNHTDQETNNPTSINANKLQCLHFVMFSTTRNQVTRNGIPQHLHLSGLHIKTMMRKFFYLTYLMLYFMLVA